MQPDALIMSDPGLIMLVREAFPQNQHDQARIGHDQCIGLHRHHRG
jgi:hypothetical protein